MAIELNTGEVVYPSKDLGTFGYIQVGAGIFHLRNLSDISSLEYVGQTEAGPSPDMHEFKADSLIYFLSPNQLHSLVKERSSA